MIANTDNRYGLVARLFHWTIAILVLADIALGLLGKFTPRTGDTVAFLQVLYSTHKTIGVTVLSLAVLRVIWAVSQPRPVPIHPERRFETFAAEAAHWVLYAAIFVLPLSGWVMHSAEVGFAPIWWPFTQNLPFIPKSESLAMTAATVHWISGIVLAVTIAAHISGALKHAVLERDGTLARMWNGREAGNGSATHVKKSAPLLAALVIWAFTIGGALTVFAPAHDVAATSQRSAQQTAGWVVRNGNLSITITQIGAQVTGGFENWQADIVYDPETGTGSVKTVIDTTSLTLGSVTDQAKGPEFFDVTNHAQAVFEGDILRIDEAKHTATGTLTLVGQTFPVTLDFDLELTNGTATVSGGTLLDRRDFGIGAAYPDESSVGFSVEVLIELTATLIE
ncbi:cytochrome b/b6 domain-containing protein [Lentibacter sp. XHP0401]|uniref:cytochrome b/b6 domain-containing protein n=1 Tax=Lentibacter sp. XHP0401 TaxID=2984334 RepID=UPI0021E7BE19|nr:cytochrome b/b6 domain-containing protein [Lentibacter sp. XHP0401]MCV2892000.1 cytochrome b/b6 domain-containing protein [Lentibacter sp. XHP0401]